MQGSFSKSMLGIALLVISSVCFAGPIVINGNVVIDKPTTYQNVVIDMSHGRFTINAGGSLKIDNSTINSTISPANPFMVTMTDGSLTLSNNKVNVASTGITPDPTVKSSYPLLVVQTGKVDISNNAFINSNPYSVEFFETQINETHELVIAHNVIKNFHGGLYLTNSHNDNISDNEFDFVSFANIFNSESNNTKIERNLFSFPGNLKAGDAIDVINSKQLNIADNIIASSASYGIFVMGGQKLFITENQITDGKSYGIYIQTPSLAAIKKSYLASALKKELKPVDNSNIVINNNYIEQNRYGLAGGVVNQLIVTDNVFIQRFQDNSTRQYWTNNDVLLPLATDFTWLNNFYKEAFTQEVPGDNSNTLQFVPFPKTGGVFLP